MEIRCPHCTHLQIVNAPYSFEGADHECSCCHKRLFPTTAPEENLNEPKDLRSARNASETPSAERSPISQSYEYPSFLERLDLLKAGDDFVNTYTELGTRRSSAKPDEDGRFERIAQNTAFETTIKETQTPDFIDFRSDAPQWMSSCRLEVLVDLPIEIDSSDEISIPVIIKTDLKGVKVAVWLRRGNTVSHGRDDYRYTKDSPCRVAITLEKSTRHFELCIRPENARNWLWCVPVPVLRKTDIAKIPRSYHFDQSRHVEGGATVLEGYTNNQITIIDNAPPQTNSRTLGLILEPLPLKPRTRLVKPVYCVRRTRHVSEFTLQWKDKTWHLHGGNSLTFGKDKPLPERNNVNDMVFRPHTDDEVWSQISRSHGTFEIEDAKIFYKHAISPQGRQQQKVIKALFSNATIKTITQPNHLQFPDPLEKVRFQPVLSVAASEAEHLEVQAWRHSLADFDLYSLTTPAAPATAGSARNNQRLAGMKVAVVSPRGEAVRKHFLITKSLIIGASANAQIQVEGDGIKSFHAYIHWLDDHLWIEACTAECRISVDHRILSIDQLCPLTENIEIVLGDSCALQVLHYV